MDFMSAKEAAAKWGISQRRVEVLCLNGQVHGVERIGSMWIIPKSAKKPIDGRTKAAKQTKNPPESKLTFDTDRIIGMVNGTMAIEYMPLTSEDKERLRTVINGEFSADEMVQQLVTKHRRSADAGFI